MRVWHQGPPGEGLLWFRSPATYGGRYHRAGSRGAWYASSKERAAWAELFRHHRSTELSPLEVRRRVGRATVRDLKVLDLTDRSIRARLGVTEEDLIDDDLALCQAIGEAARAAGFDGILAPSAALPGEMTLAVFGRGMRRVNEERSRVQRPPRSLLELLRRIRMRGSESAP